ncbi:ATP-dependent RNA helicase [Saccharomycopsis crataegensis]|uniref:ATP-dependent RNA helicase n=1 Tax=Saccharomycopsis crataegensis TaxID=43959 RepID=A0AAV5QVI9_9ASCO|nr:ATP-dependent RNA helicase [Saccharomycopsis crataegensis]
MSGKPNNDLDRFKYDEMSNKVLKADRRFVSKRNDQDSIKSQPKSLKGQISKKEMGSRIREQKAYENLEDGDANSEKQKLKKQYEKEEKRFEEKKKKSQTHGLLGSGTSLLDSNIEGLLYYPKNEDTKKTYESISQWVYNEFSQEATHEVIRSAVDALLSILKDESIANKKKECEKILNVCLSDNNFNQLSELCEQITDYHQQGEQASHGDDGDAMTVLFEDEEKEEEEEDGEEEDVHQDGIVEDKEVLTEEQDKAMNIDGLHDETEVLKFQDFTKRKLMVESIDPQWIKTSLRDVLHSLESNRMDDLSSKIFKILSDYKSISDANLRAELSELLKDNTENKDLANFISLLCDNRYKIVFRLQLLEFEEDEMGKLKVIQEMNDLELYSLMEEFEEFENSLSKKHTKKRKLNSGEATKQSNSESAQSKAIEEPIITKRQPKYVQLESLKFDQGSHLMTQSKINLPKGSLKKVKKSYEEIHVPAPAKPDMSHLKLVPIKDLPEWAQVVFPESETNTLNPIQSSVYSTAFGSDNNILLCAPTGAGKTNVAMLTMLRAIHNFRNPESGKINSNNFKIVYIAPLKALVQEQVREFSRRLKSLGLTVGELTGDSSMTKQQIKETQVIVTTPEKWDVITRKNNDTSYTNLVTLIIIDEIHLLHDERGPVLESIVARTLRQAEDLDTRIRLVGLSATLPNYKDVAEFLQVDFDSGLYYFNASYRPCPLAQQFIGITEQKAIKKINAINEACYDKVLENAGKFQVIIFVHSRKDTVKTATYLRDKLLESENLNRLLKTDMGSQEILKQESEVVKDPGLKDLIPTGFAVHHAGLSKEDRSVAEDLFAEGYVQVLVSTATLAWGVNLPAHTVIIKGTQVYSPEKGAWTELSPQDILQMLGRAGRPRYDKNGEGIIITSHSEMQYYLAILNQQLPIESQLVSKLVDNLNAEIVGGTIKSLKEGVEWLGYSYLYYRMLHSPSVYHVGADYADDVELVNKRTDLVHSALMDLTTNNLVVYNQLSGEVSSTELGKIASYYYINNESMNVYIDNLKPFLSPVDLLRVFALSGEFKYIPSRQEEKFEIKTLIGKVPIPVKELEDDPLAKVNVLLQAYISRLKLNGFALMSDMIYITQSANRIFRAIYEICLRKNWAQLAKTTLDLCKMIERRIWLSNSPFRQFTDCPSEIIRKTEASRVPWSYYLSLETPQEIGQAIGTEKFSRKAFEMIQQFPKVRIPEIEVLPITTSLLKFELTIMPEWEWNYEIHGASERFLLLVEDVNGEKILYNDIFLVRQEFVNEQHFVEFTINLPVSDSNKQQIIPPNYFITLISERWLNCEYRTPVTFFNIKLPKKFSTPTEVVDMPLVPSSQLKMKEFEKYFTKVRNFKNFNRLQSQVFDAVYNSNDNIFCGISKGSGKTLIAELAIFNYWKSQKPGRVIYINPNEEQVDSLYRLWTKYFSGIAGGKQIAKLSSSGELAINSKKVADNHLILSTPENFNLLIKRWTKQRKIISKIDLLILDDVHTVGQGVIGAAYEAIVSTTRFVMNQLEKEDDFRVVALGSSIANGRDFSEWLGVSKGKIFNFAATERSQPIEIHLRSLNINHYPSFVTSLLKSSYKYVKQYVESSGGKTLVFSSTRKQAIDIATNFIKFAKHDNYSFAGAQMATKHEKLIDQISDTVLKSLLRNGFGIYYKNMAEADRLITDRLFNAHIIKVIFASREACYFTPQANLVMVLGTQYFEGSEHRYVDYTASELLEMIGNAVRNSAVNEYYDEALGKAVIFTTTGKREYYKRFLNFAIPVESNFNYFINDSFIDEIASGVISTKQDCMDWLTYSFFYRRLQLNPSYYGVKDTTPLGLSEYLSEMIEDSLKELEDAKMIEIEEEENEEAEEEEAEEEEKISPLNGALIASHHGVSFTTVQTFNVNLLAKSNLKFQMRYLLEILSLASEFGSLVTIRKNESSILNRLYNRIPLKSSSFTKSPTSFESSISLKIFILIQAHFLRFSLSPELQSDMKIILSVVLKLLNCMIDLLSSDGNLIVLRLMTLSQLISQAVWEKDESISLKQIPFINEKILKRCDEMKIRNVNEFIEIDDDNEKLKLLGKDIADDEFKLNKVINFLNNYPIINNVTYRINDEENLNTSDDIAISVTIQKDEGVEDDEELIINSEFYPFEKFENWWIVIGDINTRTLYAIRKVVLKKEEQTFKLSFNVNEAGKHDLNIWLVCDSYYETEEVSFSISVAQAEDNSEEEEEE